VGVVIREPLIPGMQPKRLVLADPHRLVIESLGAALTWRGFDIVAMATTPQEVFAKVAEHQPDICLLSTRFLSHSGLGVLREICKRQPSVGVVMLSADRDPGLTRKASRYGAATVIPLDCHIRDIERTLARVGQREATDDDLLGIAAHGFRLSGSNHRHRGRVPFTLREQEVLTHMVDGECTQQIAHALGITEATVRTHVQNLLSKLGVHSRLEAAIVTAQTGVLGNYHQSASDQRTAGGT
jgi:two-component system, NarL family, nitrate/nitrite response regulator NarL